MQTDRRTILHLVALGRITPAEAERLLLAWNEGRELSWVFAACVAVAVLTQLHLQGLLLELVRAASALLGPGSPVLHRALALFTNMYGGIL
jgi:hypothetical protein